MALEACLCGAGMKRVGIGLQSFLLLFLMFGINSTCLPILLSARTAVRRVATSLERRICKRSSFITPILNYVTPDEKLRVVNLLKNGGIVAVPTETVYGLGARADRADAVAKIFEAKGRPATHPLIVHIASARDIEKWARDVPEIAYVLADKFWAGPLTMVFKRKAGVGGVAAGGESRETIALRVPAHHIFLDIIEQVGTGIAAPSANFYQQISPTTAEHVLDGLDGRIDAVVRGELCVYGAESTILDMTKSKPQILRLGPITHEQLEEILGVGSVQPYHAHEEDVPGNMRVHYRPSRVSAVLLSAIDIRASLESSEKKTKRLGLLYYSEGLAIEGFCASRKLASEAQLYVKHMFEFLRQLDQAGLDEIWVEMPPVGPGWDVAHDRLSKATAPWDVASGSSLRPITANRSRRAQ